MNFNDKDFQIILPDLKYEKIYKKNNSSLINRLSSFQNSSNKFPLLDLIKSIKKQNSVNKDIQFENIKLENQKSLFSNNFSNELFPMFKINNFNFKNILENLRNNIYLLFTNDFNLDYEKMEEIEAFIIYFIISRKMKKKNILSFCYLFYKKSIKQFKNKDGLKKCQKRSEEDFKFLYNLFKKNKKNHFCKKRAKNKDNFFIDYYFKDTAEKLNMDIESFSDPSNNNYVLKKNIIKKRNKKKKSLNLQFLKLIIKSKKFKDDFIKFLKNKAIDFYNSSLEHKINTLLIRIQKHIILNEEKYFKFNEEKKKIQINEIISNEFNENSNNKTKKNIILEENIELDKKIGFYEKNLSKAEIWKISIYDYLMKKKQCKIPWTISEIQKSIDNILKRIEN